MPDGLIQNEISTLGLTFDDRALRIDMQTLHQHWSAMIPKPGPFTTQVAITWEDHYYLRYYENGTLLAEVAALSDTKLPNPNKTNIQSLWLNEFTVFDRQLTKPDAKALYQKSESAQALGVDELKNNVPSKYLYLLSSYFRNIVV